ncbi:MAG: hypothetical protein IH620_02430 [Ignavibacterium sp.]|nr:hypothetical protein [Ignavibacterium sp.]HCY75477.1 hypothetical protein [Ignavibacteriales bacterium]
MKNLFELLAAFTLMLLIGCSESLPKDSNAINKSIKTSVIKERINLCCMIHDPYSGDCHLNGTVAYTHQVLENQLDLNNLKQIKVMLEVNANLCDRLGLNHLNWGLRDVSEDIVFVNDGGKVVIEKKYPIKNRDDIEIVIEYIITTEGVRLGTVNIGLLFNTYCPASN